MPKHRHLCAAPWSHLMSYASGDTSTCWSSEPPVLEQRNLGKIQETGSNEIWNNQNIKEVRKAFLAGQTPLQCIECFKLEKNGIPSDRQTNFNFDFINLEQKIAKTSPDGSLPLEELNSLELMLSNVCNFTCRTCNVASSSAWANEHQFLYKTKLSNPVVRPFDKPEETAKKIFELAPQIKRLSFIGGEPLIQPEHYHLLDLLIENNKTDLVLSYTTNLSELGLGKKDVIKYWSNFKQIFLTISLDGLGKKGEYIRKGFDWEKFKSNLARIKEECKNVTLCCNITVSMLNVLDLKEIIQYVLQEKIVPEAIKLGPVKSPLAYSITILPKHKKAEVLNHYQDDLNQDTPLASQLQGIINYMFSRDDSEKHPQFFALNKKLDLLRGEDFDACSEK